MTFHVPYNDCHLEAHMKRERERERDEGRGRRRKGNNRWMKMAEVTFGLDQTAKTKRFSDI